jgi:general secretion pathway protein D
MSGKRLMGLMVVMYVASGGWACTTQQTPVPPQPAPVPAQSVTGRDQALLLPVQATSAQSQQGNVPRRSPGVPQTPTAAAAPGRPQSQASPSPKPQVGSQPVPADEPGEPEVPASPAQAKRQPPPSPAPSGGGMVSLNFNRADLVEVIHILAQHLKLTYTIDPDVKGTVTIHSAEPLKADDLLPIFHQVLRMNGAVAVKTGNIYRITTIKEGKGIARPVGQNREDSFAIQIVPVRFFAVEEMKKLLTPFVMPGGELIDYPRGNFLIIMDLPSNIQRLVEIANLIDVQVFAGTRLEIYQPKVASAEELAQEMTKIMQSYASSVPQTETFTAQFIPLPRINRLLVVSHSEAAWTYVKRWLERIDIVAEGPGRRIFIYPVENGKATELADVLGQALGQPVTGRREPARTLEDLHRSTFGAAGQLGGSRSTTPSLGAGGSTMQQSQPFGAYATIPSPGQPPTPTATPPPAATPPPGIPRPPVAPSTSAKPEEQLRIVADPATNSLIIYGTAQEFQNIKNILKELDIVPRQVLLDVLVAEVQLTDTQSLGIEYEIFSKYNPTIFNQTFPSQGAVRTGVLPAPPLSGLTQYGTGISGVAGMSNAIRAFINAVQGDSRVKVLSSPSILASDNRPARIQVGTEEPIPTGSVTSSELLSSSTTIQYRNTGRIVTIIPQVNSQGLVNLQAKIEVSERGADVQIGTASSTVTSSTTNVFPSFTTRDAETTAVVQDGETLVIGGIIAERKARRRTGIPYLMDLPVLGRFFGSTSDDMTRTELIMMISPHVIRNQAESRKASEEFKDKLSTLRNELERMKRDQELEAEKREKMRQEQQRLMEEQKKEQQQHEEQENPVSPAPSSGGAKPSPSNTQIPRGTAPAILHETSLEPTKVAPGDVPITQIATGGGRTVAGNPLIPSEFTRSENNSEEPDVTTPIGASSSAVSSSVAEPPPIPTIAYAGATFHEDKKSTHTWVVQVASFHLDTDAQTLAKKLRESGYDAGVTTARVENKTWYRVRVGRFANRREATELQRKLEAREQFRQTVVFVH